MNCFKCNLPGEFVCNCQYLILCSVHQPLHMKETGHRSIECLDLSISHQETEKLKNEVLKRIKGLNLSIKCICDISSRIVEKVESCSKESIKNIENQVQLYIKLISLPKFSESLKKEVNKVTSSTLIIEKIDEKDVTEIENFLKVKLFSLIDISQEIRYEIIPCEMFNISDNKYISIECSDSDPVLEYRNYYYQVCALFEWDLEPKKKAVLMTQHKIQFKIKKVFKIVNPKLQQLYDKHKSEIRQRGMDPDEKWVFHGTQDQFYDEICQNGFKVGGVDINAKIKQAYGFGVYTATDPTMSIAFYNNKKIILCRGLTN